MSKFIKAKQGLNHTVLYQDESGKLVRFSGGTWSWRNHNPGNLRCKRRGRHVGQIGVAGKFAVFPDYDTGLKAMKACLKDEYKNTSIDGLVKNYAPPKENNTVLYKKFLIKKTGVTDGRKIKDFTPEEFTKLWKAIKQYEGYKVGEIKAVHKISKVKRNHKGISEFLVDTMGWITKEECLSLAKAGLVNLVVCLSVSGNEYLRARPNDPFQQDLYDIVLRGLMYEGN